MADFDISDSKGSTQSFNLPDGTDIIKSLIDSLSAAVGPAKPYSKEKTEEQKQAAETLKQMKEFTEGLEDAQEQLKEIVKILKEKKGGGKGSSDFGNVGSAFNKIFRQKEEPRRLGSLEEQTLKKLSKMADEAVNGHSLSTADHTMHDLLKQLNGYMQNITATIAKLITKSGSGGGRSGGGSAYDMPGAIDMGEAAETMSAMHESMSYMSEESRAIADSIERWKKSAGKFAGKLNMTESAFTDMLDKLKFYSIEDAALFDKMLNKFNRLSDEERKKLLKAAQKLLEAKNAMMANPGRAAYREHYEAMVRDFQNMGERAGEALNKGFIQRATGKLEKIRQDYIGPFKNLADKLNIAEGIIPKSDLGEIHKAIKESSDYLREMNSTAFALSGTTGNLLDDASQWKKDLYDIGKDVTGIFETTGMTSEVFRKQLLKNLRRGITETEKLNKVTRTGGAVAHVIGANAEQTSDELAHWVQMFDLSAASAMNLGNQIKQIGRQTGVMGDNLLQVAATTRAMADQMRKYGNFSLEANKALLQFNATAKKMGTENIATPHMQAIMGGQIGLMNAPEGERRLALQAAGGDPQLMKALMDGSLQNNPELMKRYAARIQMIKSQMFGGKNVKDMTAEELRIANLKTQGAFGKGAGEFELLANTITSGSESSQDKIDKLQKQLANPNLGQKRRKDIENEIARYREGQAKDKLGSDLTTISSVRDAMEGGQSMSNVLRNKGMTEQQLRETLEKSVETINKNVSPEKRISNDRINEALKNGQKFDDLVHDMNELNQNMENQQKNDGTDPVTKAIKEQMIINETHNKIVEDNWREMLEQVGSMALVVPNNTSQVLNKLYEMIGLLPAMLGAIGALTTLIGLNNLRQGLGGAGGLGGGAAGAAGRGLGRRLLGGAGKLMAVAAVADAITEGVKEYQETGARGGVGAALGSNMIRDLGVVDAVKDATGSQTAADATDMFTSNAALIGGRVAGLPGYLAGAAVKGTGDIIKYDAQFDKTQEAIRQSKGAMDEIYKKRYGKDGKSLAQMEKELSGLDKEIGNMGGFREEEVGSYNPLNKQFYKNKWDRELRNNEKRGHNESLQRHMDAKSQIEAKKEEYLQNWSDALLTTRKEGDTTYKLSGFDNENVRKYVAQRGESLLEDQKQYEEYKKKKAAGGPTDKLYEMQMENRLGDKRNDESMADYQVRRITGYSKEDTAALGMSPIEYWDKYMGGWMENSGAEATMNAARKKKLDEESQKNMEIAFQELADLQAEMEEYAAQPITKSNEVIMQKQIQDAFDGTEATESVSAANDYLFEISDYNRQQLEVMKEELQTLKMILSAMSSDGGTTDLDAGSKPSNYYEWKLNPLGVTESV